MRTKRPFFIVGTGRSGTTLLQAMFMAAPGIFIPPETHFLPIARRVARRHGPPSTGAGFEHLIREILATCARQEMPVNAEVLQEELRASPRTCGDLFDTLLAHIRDRRTGCRRLGEKSTVHLPFAGELLEMFRDGQVITIIRDGRDVALSNERSLGRNTLRAAFRWRQDQRLHARWAATLPPDRYTSVRYEALVTRPQEELERLCAFLDEPFREEMLRPHERSETGFAAWEAHKALTMQPVTTARIGRYRSQLSPAKIALVQMVAGAELRANDYPLEPVAPLPGLLLGLRQLPNLLLTQVRKRRGEVLAGAPAPPGGQ